jgi:hypothetical protein
LDVLASAERAEGGEEAERGEQGFEIQHAAHVMESDSF